MASRPRIVLDAGRDLISNLPVELKDRILECLSTRDVARTALLSTHWKDVWLRHGRLVFDDEFFRCVQKCRGYKTTSIVNIINNILLLRAGPVKKFTLNRFSDPKPCQSDIERWCNFLSRNGVEELVLYFSQCIYKLPVCMFSCPTIKLLKLHGFLVDLPVNADCIFPRVTLLCFRNVEFKDSRSVNGIASHIPNLEKLILHGYAEGIDKFEISAPKLKSLSCIVSDVGFESRWLSHHLKAIKTLCLCGITLWCDGVSMLPTAMNLEVLQLYNLNFKCGKELTYAMQLLQKFPNLLELGIVAIELSEDKGVASTSSLLEDPDRCFINQDMKMLNTVKIEWFSGSPLQKLFVKSVFSKSPALERVVIQESDEIKASFKILRELSRFPRASPKAQLVYMEYKPKYRLVGFDLDAI